MNAFNYYLHVLKNYVNFEGRARRSEYWYFVLFNAIFSVVFELVDNALGFSETGLLGSIYSLAVLLPSIAVAIRRAHDVGKSGWFMLIPFYNLYLAVQDSQPGTNEYGANPKENGYDDQINQMGQKWD